MALFSIQKSKLLGNLLVAMQFGLLIGLAALALPNTVARTMPLGALVLAGAAFVLGTWTLIHNRPGNFNIHPAPKALGTLITTGPYRFIRHPMYTAVILLAASLACLSNSLSGFFAWTALVGVLLLKSLFEEQWLRQQHRVRLNKRHFCFIGFGKGVRIPS